MASEQPLDIGNRRELFVDRYLIDNLEGHSEMRLQQPRSAGVALRFDQPWEGAFSGYATVVKDEDRYRMYYRAWPDNNSHKKAVTCLAESEDGLNWTRPNLGLYTVNGTRNNNVILTCEEDMYTHNFAPMIDDRPGVSPDQRYKALTRNYGLAFKNERTDPMGLFAFVSSDGVHWHKLCDEPVLTEGKFDSLNVPFWSSHEGCYVCYLREGQQGVRSIARSWSDDFIHWSSPELMDFGDTPPEQLYTNATTPYFRAPHIYIALPGRFMQGRQVLSPEEADDLGVHRKPKGGGFWSDCSDAVFMTSRGGNRYDRTFMEAFVRPGRDRRNWTSRCNYPGCGLVQTDTDELSFYIERHNGQDGKHLERQTLRLDGFASVNAGYAGGEMLTKPLLFQGERLTINYATSAVGAIRVELQTPEGEPISGYTLDDCDEIIGDHIERTVSWQGETDVSHLAGQGIPLRFEMKDADLFAIQFQ